MPRGKRKVYNWFALENVDLAPHKRNRDFDFNRVNLWPSYTDILFESMKWVFEHNRVSRKKYYMRWGNQTLPRKPQK